MGVQQRKDREKENLRREILSAARDLFAREGIESVSIRRIAQRIEYSPGTIYLYFEDKAEILRTLCEETFTKLHQKLKSIQDDHADSLGSLRRGLRAYIEFGLQNSNQYLVTFVLSGRYLYDANRRDLEAGLACFDNLRGIVRRCMEEGHFRLNDVEEVSQSLWAGVHGITSLLITKPGFPFVEHTRLVDRVVDVLIEGVRRH